MSSDDRFTVLESREVYSSNLTRIRVDRVRMPQGDTAQREIVEHLPAVGAVPLTDSGDVVLLRQYRHAFGRRFLEIPAGKLDVEGEDPVAAVQRELAEEVRLEAATLTHLVTFNNSAGWTTEWTAVYLAQDLTQTERPADFELEHEEVDMEVLEIPLEEAVAMVRDGEIVDAKTVVGLLAVADLRAVPDRSRIM